MNRLLRKKVNFVRTSTEAVVTLCNDNNCK